MVQSRLSIMVVDDEAAMREVLEMRLEKQGFETHLAASAADAEQLAQDVEPDLVISDVALPDLSGLELLKTLKAGNPDRPVVLITAYGTVDSAVEAMKDGALDFLTKPIDYAKLDAVLAAARSDIERRSTSRSLEHRLNENGGLGLLVGTAKPMREVYALLQTLAQTEASAIITGESGTGKELAAQTIHLLGKRAKKPFIAVNTSAIAEGITESELFGHEKGAFTGAVAARPGYFEMAHTGTLFLDEIGEMPMPMQPKLLRILEESKLRRLGSRRETPIDIRVLAATNRDPQESIRNGHLREDLFYRLGVFTVEMPPLRERADDIPLLAQHFIRLFNDKHTLQIEGIGPEAIQTLGQYTWPGNVRELKNAVERAAILARHGWIEEIHLPPFLRDGSDSASDGIVVPTDSTVAEAEKILILETLKRHGNNKTRAAKALGLDVRTIRYKLRAYETQ